VLKKEINFMESALLDSFEDPNLQLYETLRRKVAAIKIQKLFKHRLKVLPYLRDSSPTTK
jgi:hypothetical protein